MHGEQGLKHSVNTSCYTYSVSNKNMGPHYMYVQYT